MRKALVAILIFLILALGFSSFAEAKTTRVKGYYKPSSGKYIQPHYRTSPNKSRFDNWSTKGNYNPYTGKKGTTSPLKSYRLR